MKLLKGHNKGVALIIVLTSVAILSAFSTELSYRAFIDVRMAKNEERQVQAYFYARSAMEIARLVITSQKFVQQIIGAMTGGRMNIRVEVWPFAAKFVEVFSTGKLAFAGIPVLDLKDSKGVGVQKNGGFKVTVEPEDSKVDINNVIRITDKRNLVLRMLALFQVADIEGYKPEDRKTVELIANIIDWVDPDNSRTDIDTQGHITSSAGDEGFAYDKYGYKVKNAKFDTLSELHLVDGITDEIYCKLAKALTVYKTDKVNVNEADPLLLKALICENLVGVDPNVACGIGMGPQMPGMMSPVDQVVSFIEVCRQIKKALFMPPFPNTQAFINLLNSIPPPLNQYVVVDKRRLRSMIGTGSRVLRVKATGWVGNTAYTMETVIDTLGDNYIYWKEYGSSKQE